MRREIARARQLSKELEPGAILLDTELSREIAQILLTLAYLVEDQNRTLCEAGLARKTASSESLMRPPELTEEGCPETSRRATRTPLLPPDN